MLSDDILTANLQALARRLGAVPALQRPDPERCRLSRDGSRLLVDVRTVDGRWQRTAPPHVDETGRAIEAWQHGASGAVVLAGPSLGDVLEAAEAAGLMGPVIAIEPDPVLALLMLARRDWRPWFEAGLSLLVGPAYAGASGCARALDPGREPLIVEAAAVERPTVLAEVRTVVARILGEARANQEARRRFAGRYLLQTLGNLEIIASEGDVGSLAGAFSGTPAVIVGAGPSLDGQLTALRSVADRALVIASDTTLRPLDRAGIVPHLAVAVDPGDANARHLIGMDQLTETWLVGEGSLDPRGFGPFRNRTFLFEVSGHEPWPWLAAHGLRRGRLRAWGSVVTSAMDLALTMGCDPIVFVGADFAFTGGRTYCRHTAHEALWEQWVAAGDTWENVWSVLMRQWPVVHEPDLNGRPLRTAPHLVAFRNWIADQASAARPRRIVNATGAGILCGADIAQAPSPTAVLGEARCLSRSGVRAALARAHGESLAGSPAARLPVLRAALDGGQGDALYDRWQAFAGGTLTRAAVADALGGTDRRLTA